MKTLIINLITIISLIVFLIIIGHKEFNCSVDNIQSPQVESHILTNEITALNSLSEQKLITNVAVPEKKATTETNSTPEWSFISPF